ncbi:hypothetical protein O9H85_18385 [Paenibacillus filicis]|uniref:Uncharacterized protein n=1 Tax=Paenibacillus gyeongsangnamensis TaxID=3388067 RepID=A0ABT4QC07_9BACL|nr:hypothetical protein [Paenibacillus filicis]MCZ8514355.1 hypothetical protein [Paenibacillus filicis]
MSEIDDDLKVVPFITLNKVKENLRKLEMTAGMTLEELKEQILKGKILNYSHATLEI